MMILAERLMVVDVTRVYIYVYPPPSMYPDIYEFPITSVYNLRVILRQQKQYLLRTNIDKVVMRKGK